MNEKIDEAKKEFVSGYTPVTLYGGIKAFETLNEIANFWELRMKEIYELGKIDGKSSALAEVEK